MNIVFLDRDTLQSRPFQFNFDCQYTEYPLSTAEEALERTRDADIVITNKVLITEELLAANPRIKMVTLAATGYNNVDLEAAKRHGVTICNVRAYGNDSVAEHALMFMFALMRNLPAYMRDVSAGVWEKAPFFCHYGAPIRNLNGKTLTIFGCGNIGKRLGEIATVLGMNVVWGEHKNAVTVRDGYTEFNQAIQMADVISLHCPLSEQTRHMIGEAELQMMKPQAILINVGRGGLVDEQAALVALKYGQLGGAGFDVLTTEPPKDGNPLLAKLPNLIVTPHMAWASEEALDNMTRILEDNIHAFVAGKPQNVVG
ncbi:D-2-hydroxyacid dehydrogenase [Kingella kingae]|uniref:D-2-hydroxyacid dehydrogenase n=1 Tax=Kingella kingae TaxID=504 RepID=UPI00254EF623|nr:D-2-hydroxyacid dehydrogenase [Kingella kingae]MDK4596906.1 D-2-hydroxyacid dehydrogenase [Kingella kingae]MDK4600886.1 D-2-hydroxyacid dehydrogenase [Kingella kingae]MDK4654585.1 D-2-hydroxyacid dehydrogenase [Kingella kingae]